MKNFSWSHFCLDEWQKEALMSYLVKCVIGPVNTSLYMCQNFHKVLNKWTCWVAVLITAIQLFTETSILQWPPLGWALKSWVILSWWLILMHNDLMIRKVQFVLHGICFFRDLKKEIALLVWLLDYLLIEIEEKDPLWTLLAICIK